MAVRREFVEGLYRDLLGRGDNFTPNEVEGWLGAQDENAVRNMFLGSKEYTDQHGGNATWMDVGGQITPTTPPVLGGGAPDYHGYEGDTAPPPPTQTPPPPPGGGAYNVGNLGRGWLYDNFAAPTSKAGSTPKYDFARIATDYAPKPSNLKAIVNDPRFREKFPSARLVGKDAIDFGAGIGVVDVGKAFDENADTGDAWGWLTPELAGSGSGGGATATQRRGGDLVSLGEQFGGPGGPGVTNGPLQQVGQDPFSQLLTGALTDFMQRGGSTDFGDFVKSALTDYMGGGGSMNKRYESARELANKGRRAMIADSRASLADRGLLSEPGAPSGIEAGVLRSINEDVSEEFARTIRDIASDQDDKILPVLQIATSLSQSEASNLLGAIGQGTSRQTALAGLALQQLSQNMAWNQFLAEFGLKRDQALQMLSNGQTDDLIQLMNMFLSMGSLLRGGFV